MCDILLLWWVGKLCIDLWHEGACAVRLPPLKLTSCLEYALRHWAWLTSPTWCRNPGKSLQSLGERLGSMVAHCGLWCTLLLCALACLWSRCGHDFESSGPHGRGSGPTCLTVWERTEEPTDSGIFPRGPPSLWVSYTSGVWACEAPVYVFSISSPTWVLVNERGSGPTCLTVWERTGEWTDFGAFPRGPPSLWVSYTSGVGACEAPVCVFSILFSRTLVHRADSVQQLSVSGRGSGPMCLAVCELNDFGVFPRGPPSLWVSYTSGVGACEAPVYVFSILSSPTWVLVNERGSGPTCLTVWERTGEWTDFGAFPRGPPSLWVSYTSGVGACEAPVCVFSILFSRTLVHRADSVQQLSVSGRGSGPMCLAVCELNDFGVFPRGPPSLWVSYTSGVGACEAPVCVFSILFSRTLVHRADSVQQLSVSGRGRLLVHVGLVTVTGTTVSSSYPNNILTMASELERKRTACKGWATRSANSLKDYL